MSRKRPARVPPYPKSAHASGQAKINLGGKSMYLGKFGTAESLEKYRRVIAEHMVRGKAPSKSATITELVTAYLASDKVASYQVGEYGRGERQLIEAATRPLIGLYGSLQAADMTPLRIICVRDQMLQGGLSPRTANAYIIKLRRMFEWGGVMEYCPKLLHYELRAVKAIRAGRANVPPIPPGDFERTVEQMNTTYGTMAMVQYLSGARPSEVCRMQPSEIDQTGEVWLWTVARHKNTWRENERKTFTKVLALGPQAQRLLAPFLAICGPDEPVFKPQSGRGYKGKPMRLAIYYDAIARACRAAGVPHWHPHQIKHTRATDVRSRYGKEAAAASTGNTLGTIDIYAERDIETAKRVAKEMG